ncbi:hypothetical protein EYF80_005183 [Liparis tanakae]|uniref:Uncharacterized protein n=1 Tax=Liparis tanakae TaxID=230148 RepID=A0A4Z2J4R4_9TELE|nr:hypothetical protein EYF80_005183 [Liparis tanakae]
MAVNRSAYKGTQRTGTAPRSKRMVSGDVESSSCGSAWSVEPGSLDIFLLLVSRSLLQHDAHVKEAGDGSEERQRRRRRQQQRRSPW